VVLVTPRPPRLDWEHQGDDPIIVAALTVIVREADETFQRLGAIGSSRHWIRDCFLPALNRHRWFVDTVADLDDDTLAS
jgi:hypothetical protein